MPPRKPLVRRVREAVRNSRKIVSRAVERNFVGKLIRNSSLGMAAREIKAKTIGRKLSQRAFLGLRRRIEQTGATDAIVETVKRLPANQKKELFALLTPARKTHLEKLLKK